MYSRCTVNMMFPGAVGLYLCILLIPVLKIEAIPAITKTDTSIPYGIISQTTALTCTDSTYDPATSTFKFLKSGTEILNNIGEISTNGKYSATPSAGSIEMTIKDVAISDQTSYTCSVGFTSSPSSYSLEVEVKPTNDTTATVGVCTGPGNDNCGDKLTFTCTNLYPSPSDISVMDGTQTVVGANKSTTKPNGMFDLEWTATNSTSPKTYILTIAITTRSTYTITVENTINDCECKCKTCRIIWIVIFFILSFASGAWTAVIKLAVPKAKKWLKKSLFGGAYICMILWVFVSVVISIVAVIIYNIRECDWECHCYSEYIIIGIVVKVGDVIVNIIGVTAICRGN